MVHMLATSRAVMCCLVSTECCCNAGTLSQMLSQYNGVTSACVTDMMAYRMHHVILDEADLLLSGGFERDVGRILDGMKLSDKERKGQCLSQELGIPLEAFQALPRHVKAAAYEGSTLVHFLVSLYIISAWLAPAQTVSFSLSLLFLLFPFQDCVCTRPVQVTGDSEQEHAELLQPLFDTMRTVLGCTVHV